MLHGSVSAPSRITFQTQKSIRTGTSIRALKQFEILLSTLNHWAIPENIYIPTMDHAIGYLKISGFPRRTTAAFAGLRTPLIQNLEEFWNSARFRTISLEFQSKFTKLWRYWWISSQAHRAFTKDFQCRP